MPSPAIHRVEPGFSGLDLCRLEGNLLGTNGLRLDAERSDSTERDPVYRLLLDQLGARQLPLRADEPLRFTLGTDSLVLQPAGFAPERRVFETEFLMTRWRYQVTEEELAKLAASETAELAALTARGFVRAPVSTAARAAVAGFLKDCASGASRAPSAGPVRAGASDPWIPVNYQEYTSTASGLRFKDEVQGSGIAAKSGDQVSVHYTGWLEDGTKFDSSRDRSQPFEFALGAGSVIRGWDEGVQGMHVGGRRRLVIPPDLGYGNRAVGGVIPASSTLVFEVELLAAR